MKTTRHRTAPIPETATAIVLALGLLAGPAAPARASLPSLPSLPSLRVPPVVTLSIAQAEADEHAEGIQMDADPWRNLAAPLIMVAAGLLYLGFVRWKIGRQRGHGAAR